MAASIKQNACYLLNYFSHFNTRVSLKAVPNRYYARGAPSRPRTFTLTDDVDHACNDISEKTQIEPPTGTRPPPNRPTVVSGRIPPLKGSSRTESDVDCIDSATVTRVSHQESSAILNRLNLSDSKSFRYDLLLTLYSYVGFENYL